MARTPSSKQTASRQDTDPAKIAEPDHATRDAANGGAHAEPSGDPDGTHDPDTYAVGYGRPPLHSRFKRGQSGNTKGRQKQSRNMRTVLQQVLSEDMQIREGGRVRRMPAFEALVRTTLSRAFKGDPKAMASLLVLVRHCGYGADHDAPAAELLSGTDVKAIIDDYFDRTVPEPQTPTKAATAEETPHTAPSAPSAARPQKPR
jgi:hypothetical protein